MSQSPTIIYTKTDKPSARDILLLAHHQGVHKQLKVAVETRDISLAGRILAGMSTHLLQTSRYTMPSRSSASWPRPLTRTSSSSQTSPPRCPAQGRHR